MMSTQLGRMILDSGAARADEMSAAPDQDGRYDPIDGLLEEIAELSRSESRSVVDRRPGSRSTDFRGTINPSC